MWLRGLSAWERNRLITHMSNTEVTQQQVPAPAATLNGSPGEAEASGNLNAQGF